MNRHDLESTDAGSRNRNVRTRAIQVPFDKMPALKSIPQAERSMFDVDEDGSYIHWPGRDIHVDLDGIRAAIDPGWRVKILAAKATHDRRYGAAIAKLRTAKGLKQSAITGLSERQVRRIEKGEGTTYESLRRLAAAHEMDTSEYLRQVAVTLKDFDSSHDEHGHKQLATA